MSTLGKLKFVSAKRVSGADATQSRRVRMCARIDEQIAMIKAAVSGGKYLRTRVVEDIAEDGSTTEREVSVRKRQWFWIDSAGNALVSIRYGSGVLELQRGKNAIQAPSLTALVDVLELVQKAVASGELDALMATVCENTRKRFKKA